MKGVPRDPIKELPAQDELFRLFSYFPGTGELIWRVRSGPRSAGQRAGTILTGKDGKRYWVVGINKVYYYSHRIVWKIMTGKDPGDFIDHKDGNRLNLSWTNLREASNGQNIQNSKLRSDNRSGVKGVHWDANARKWRAVISSDKRSIRLGRFNTIDEARAAIINERVRLHGEFARAA